METTNPEYEVVLWGATGFTGQLVAEHFAEYYESSDLDWAIAGRNEQKLQALRNDLSSKHSELESLPILTGDAFEHDSLRELAKRTKVVCSTVGPYSIYGSDLVAACVETNTDYCDLTGEAHWIQKMIDRHHDTARENQTCIIHSCGFDSIPSDIGTLMVQEFSKEQFGVPCNSVNSYAKSSSFNMSGGTLASMVKTFEDASKDPETREALRNPYSLAPRGERDGNDGGIQKTPLYDSDIDQWTAPFVMAITNEKVVRRSNALLNYKWGREFLYSETLPTGSGLKGLSMASGMAGVVALMMGSFAIGPVRNFLANYIFPDSGEGPDQDTMQNSSFELRLIGNGKTTDDEDSFQVEGIIQGNRDPGYGSTAWMIGESAICLAKNETDTPLEGGVLTPASGIGLSLIDRLSEVGMSFSVEAK